MLSGVDNPAKFKAAIVQLLVGKGLAETTAAHLHHEMLSIYKQHYPERHHDAQTTEQGTAKNQSVSTNVHPHASTVDVDKLRLHGRVRGRRDRSG